MGASTAIEWTDMTWSPWEGCQKVGPGCDHCYAESMNRWLRRGENWGPGAVRRIYSDDHWVKPLRWNAAAASTGQHLKVFPSICDPFDNAAPRGQRERFANLIVNTPQLIWMLLTKRIGNAAPMLTDMFPDGTPSNVWLGATIVNQTEADRDIPKLIDAPAATRFLSMEPLLGAVNLYDWIGPWGQPVESQAPPMIDGIFVGGESGRGARPMHPSWARSLRDQCAAAGIAFHFKQWGEWAPGNSSSGNDLIDRDRQKIASGFFDYDDQWNPLGPNAFRQTMDRIGKKAAGRLLDGHFHDDFPPIIIAH
ncbi:phage Gp37/Gp68 family protein [Paraburkholderia hospita]|jgi:protein gp37|uniref:phage Gp37/Gp68 family protein n=1 Tax=Paraburkholderia hospita TaxID=169430 RepID=UPI003ECD4886